ncbi:MAG: DUF1553 domain-containing protein [Verrucomicrobia bacterium]|nr:DUF1553 domain-containing protein [Verrucomicrobiota bacterium]
MSAFRLIVLAAILGVASVLLPLQVRGVATAMTLTDAKSFWSFQPVQRPAPPKVKDAQWPTTEIDRFILAKLEANKLKPAPDADPRTLIRRLTFDLTGLPPTPEEAEAFVRECSSIGNRQSAIAKAADRLLASPHYGERWGRHWLDVVRYADTSGCNSDVPIPDAWRYRNYVIESFNRDKPYDQFLREQLAGDLLPATSEAQRREQIIATGYLPLSRRFSSVAEEFHLTLDDTVDNVGKTFLGLSVSCARCHDHKFDPLSVGDYYGLYGIFQSTRYAFPGTEIQRHRRDLTALLAPEEHARVAKAYEEKIAMMDAEMDRLYAHKITLDTGKEKNAVDAAFKKLQRERDALLTNRPPYETAYAVSEGKPENARIQLKGDPAKLGSEVPRGFLAVLGGQKLSAAEKGSGRRELADWIASPKNPLTARVMVNRIWQHHFGAGLIRTPNDFGVRGEKPTHPGLLDWLADEFVRSGWSVKALHKQIVLSRVYQLASGSGTEHDPDNKLISHFNRRRLTAEETRDAMLAMSGLLDRTPDGPHPFKPEAEWRYTQHNPFIGDFETRRRSVYLMQQRIRQQPMLGVFDGADCNMPVGQRTVSTTPMQALFLLNNKFTHEAGDAFAARVLAGGKTSETRLTLASQLALGRPPKPEELRFAKDYLAAMPAKLAAANIPEAKREQAAWASYLRTLMSGNEFVFVD